MPDWEIRIVRDREQTNPADGEIRTVGSYGVWWNGAQVADFAIPGGVVVPLAGTTAEAKGPGSNEAEAIDERCIAPGRYRLGTWDGDDYQTDGYSPDPIVAGMPWPGIWVRGTQARSAILIHPGKDEFLSSTGCINLCTALPDAAETISYPGSRRRVIALIEHMKQCLGDSFPTSSNRRIPNAWVRIS